MFECMYSAACVRRDVQSEPDCYGLVIKTSKGMTNFLIRKAQSKKGVAYVVKGTKDVFPTISKLSAYYAAAERPSLGVQLVLFGQNENDGEGDPGNEQDGGRSDRQPSHHSGANADARSRSNHQPGRKEKPRILDDDDLDGPSPSDRGDRPRGRKEKPRILDDDDGPRPSDRGDRPRGRKEKPRVLDDDDDLDGPSPSDRQRQRSNSPDPSVDRMDSRPPTVSATVDLPDEERWEMNKQLESTVQTLAGQ